MEIEVEVHLQEGHPERLSRVYLHYQDQFDFSTWIKPSNGRNITKSKFESQRLLYKMRKKLPLLSCVQPGEMKW